MCVGYLMLSISVLASACHGRLDLFRRVAGAAGAGGETHDQVELPAANGGSFEGGAPGGSGNAPDAGGAIDPVTGDAGAAGARSVSTLLIDDFEDRDTHAQSPLGWWYKVNDGSATQALVIEPSAGKRAGAYALHSYGGTFTSWGAVVGVNFQGQSLIDATPYAALRFWANATPGAIHTVTVDLIASGNIRSYAPPLTLTDGWAEYRLLLADFFHADRSPLDPKLLQGLQFEVEGSSELDLWLDDVELVP